MDKRFFFVETDEEVLEYAMYFFNRLDKMPFPYSVPVCLSLIGRALYHGRIMCSRDGNGCIDAILNYIFGTRENGYHDKDNVEVDLVLIDSKGSMSRAFFKGCLSLIEDIHRLGIPVKRMLFNGDSNNPYLMKLYTRFAKVIDCSAQSYRFEADFEEFASFIHNFRLER